MLKENPYKSQAHEACSSPQLEQAIPEVTSKPMSKFDSTMSWLLLAFILGLNFHKPSEASFDRKQLPSAAVAGAVYCDTCFQHGFSKASHFISGATVAIECKEDDSSPRFYKEAKTNEHGEFEVNLPVSVAKRVDKIKACSVKLLSSSEPLCAVVSTATSSSSLKLKGRKEGTHIFSAGDLTFKPLKQPQLCNQKPTLFKPSNAIKISVPVPGISGISVPGVPQIPPPVSVPGVPRFGSPISVPAVPTIPSPISVPGAPTIPSPISVPGVPRIPTPISVPSPPKSQFQRPPLPRTPDLPLPQLPPLPVPPLPVLQQQNPNKNPIANRGEGQSPSKTFAFPTPPIFRSPIPSIGGVPLPPNPFLPPSTPIGGTPLPPNPFRPPSPITGVPSSPFPGSTQPPPAASMFPPIPGFPGIPGNPPSSTASAEEPPPSA